jgi:O-antigen/teichoic acid export membrane protein
LLKFSATGQPFSLRRNFSWALVGNVFYSACQWGMLIILAKIGTPEMVGEFTLALALTAPVFMLANLQLRAIQATDHRSKYSLDDYLALRLVSTGIAFFVIMLIAASSTYLNSTRWVIIVIAIAKGFESISDIFYGFIQQRERMDYISISLTLKGILSLLMLTIGVLSTGSILGGVIGLAMAWLILLLSYDLLTVKHLIKQLDLDEAQKIRPHWHWPTQGKLVKLALPLGFVMLLVSLNTNVPRYFIERFMTPRELGIFAAIAFLPLIGSVIQGALAQTASPRLAKYYAEGKRRDFIRLLLSLISIALLLGLSAIIISTLAGKTILTLVYKPEYSHYSNLLLWLMAAAALDYVSSFLGTAITSVRYFRSQVPIIATTLVILSMSCFYFIPILGLIGIPISMMIAEVVRIFLFGLVLTHALSKKNISLHT